MVPQPGTVLTADQIEEIEKKAAADQLYAKLTAGHTSKMEARKAIWSAAGNAIGLAIGTTLLAAVMGAFKGDK